jgi:hypothetical protein
MIQFEIKKKTLEEEAKDYAYANRIRSKEYVKRYVTKKLNHFEPMVEVINNRLLRFNPGFFEVTEIFDNLTD